MKINNLDKFFTPKELAEIQGIPDMNYETPVKMIMGQFETKLEGDTLSAIQSYGIEVDKDELIKALQYDRNSYKKGYKDAHKLAHWVTDDELHMIRHCSNCRGSANEYRYPFCPWCGCYMKG